MATVPNHAKQQYLNGAIDWVNDTIRVALINDTTAFSLDVDNHEFVADVLDGGTTAEEFGQGSGTGYSRQTVANASTSQDNTDDEGVADGDDVTFSGLDGATIQGVLVYKQVGGDDTTEADDPILYYLDDADVSDLPKPTNGGDITVQWAAEGIVNLA
jgi:cell shape-determining protein MreC